MTPRQHRTSTRVLAPPPGLTTDECAPLAVTDTTMNNAPAVASFWYPDADELAMLQAGHPVGVVIAGSTHPPISVGVALEP